MKHEPRPAINTEKQLGWARKVGGMESGDLQDRANSVSQVVKVSDMVPICQPCGSVAGRTTKGTVASACLSVWEKAVPQLPP